MYSARATRPFRQGGYNFELKVKLLVFIISEVFFCDHSINHGKSDTLMKTYFVFTTEYYLSTDVKRLMLSFCIVYIFFYYCYIKSHDLNFKVSFPESCILKVRVGGRWDRAQHLA